ncbi:MAG: hypothetical protein PWQ62_340 [Candidatus Methanomethylophilaceae archaeon]|nr:hypothetical protein [Candidatus Methanomethylophilaceae archaeon]
MGSRQTLSYDVNGKRRAAFHLIILLGIVSLFGDITYEGARSITGPYLALLGASAGIVGLVSGLGEFVGYAFRLVSGYLADRTQAYWTLTIIGYGLILSIPLLAFAGQWQLAALLIILERIGKALRTPARDTILSHATKEVGRGWGFGIHEALDQIGAVVGPLIFSAVFILNGGYREGFTILWIPAILTLAILFIARREVPSPEKLEIPDENEIQNVESNKLPRIFWLYTLFAFLTVAGFANFQLISYHLNFRAIVPVTQIPVLYAIAMGVDALVALLIGKAYDKVSLRSLIVIPLFTIPLPLLAFSHSYAFAVISIMLWGAVMGVHETIMRAAIADITPIERRGTAYGIFNTIYGASWFFGGVVMGFLYDFSISYLVIFAIVMEIVSIPVFLSLRKGIRRAAA